MTTRRAAIDEHPDEQTAAQTVPGAALAHLKLDEVTRIFGDAVAVSNMTLAATTGEFVSFLGPSGCGKTTTLSMIAGFLEPTSGTIEIRGRRVDNLPPEKRNTGMVFQDYALFPHMSVAENVGFGLRMRHIANDEIRVKVTKALQMVRMGDFGDRRPSQLSGGQQQRVALARALVITPDVLLLDEPFGALDRQLRDGMQLELKTLQQSVGITTIFVTHDQEEALSMSDRIVVMNKGVIDQIGDPIEIYERPQTTFVARFIGKSNAFPGTVSPDSHTVIDTPLGRIPVSAQGAGLTVGQTVECIIRPEKMRFVDGARSVSECSVRCRIQQIVYQGAGVEFHLIAGDLPLIATARSDDNWLRSSRRQGAEVEIAWAPENMLVFRDGKRCA